MDTKKNKDKNDFWDIASLLPPKKQTGRTQPVARDTETVEIVVASPAEKAYSVQDVVLTEHYVTPPKREAVQAPLAVYHPEGSLIHEVRVYPWRTQYDYYARFRHHVQAFWQREGEECPIVPFFSYMPQYNQMNSAQLASYFHWRSCFRRERYLEVDFSYLLLALYELIHAPDDPLRIQGEMVRLWVAYRAAHPRLDALVREWLCDYSLLHGLGAPALPPKLYRELLSGCRLKEFYVPVDGAQDCLVRAVLLFCNNYDYTKSKFFTPDTAEDYHSVLRGAVGVALEVLREREGSVLVGGGGVSTVSRDTFIGAICAQEMRRRIEVDYTSFSHTHELRYMMSDVLKYAENGLRAARGIKSRLTIYALDAPLRVRLDDYLCTVLPTRVQKQEKKAEQAPAYLQRYDLPATKPSASRAAEIEAASWQTTKRLVEAFEGVSEEAEAQPVPIEKPITKAPVPEEKKDAFGGFGDFLRLVASGADAAAQRRYADEKGMILDAIADQINTVTGDILGDIVLEEAGRGYALVEDYRAWLEQEGMI